MVIRKQAVISWLLTGKFDGNEDMLGVPILQNPVHFAYLSNGFIHLDEARKTDPDWGLPELLMPSFEKVMAKSARAFFNIDHQLFQEFYEDSVCGILLTKDCGTIVYGFGEDKLYVWLFNNQEGKSQLYLYFYIESTPDNRRLIYTCPTLASDTQLFDPEMDNTPIYERVANKLMVYLAVKKYVKVETVVVPVDGTVKMSQAVPDYHYKDKIMNVSGQEVVVMDSRWFRRIVNDNEIMVRGFFRLQNKKNACGQWYKELIFVDSYIRHGYHREAKVEEERQIENGRTEIDAL